MYAYATLLGATSEVSESRCRQRRILPFLAVLSERPLPAGLYVQSAWRSRDFLDPPREDTAKHPAVGTARFNWNLGYSCYSQPKQSERSGSSAPLRSSFIPQVLPVTENFETTRQEPVLVTSAPLHDTLMQRPSFSNEDMAMAISCLHASLKCRLGCPEPQRPMPQ